MRSSKGTGRIVLGGVSLDRSGPAATATVELVSGDRRVKGKAVGRNVKERWVLLAAEATARAVTELLSDGHGVVLHSIRPVSAEAGEAILAIILFLTPTKEQFLFGIAPVSGETYEAAAKAVLSAANRRLSPVSSKSR